MSSVSGYGYLAAGIGSDTPYRPVLYLETRLVRASDKAVLMSDRIRYNPVNQVTQVITIPPDPAYDFKDFDTLVGHPDSAMAGAESGIGAVGTNRLHPAEMTSTGKLSVVTRLAAFALVGLVAGCAAKPPPPPALLSLDGQVCGAGAGLHRRASDTARCWQE